MFRARQREKKCMSDFPYHAAVRRSPEVHPPSGPQAPRMLDKPDQDGNTPLHLAAERGHSKWVEYLITNQADVNAVNKFGMNALLLAVRHSHPDLVLFLLNHGANAHFVNDQGQTVLHYAACTGDETIVSYLLKHKVKVNLQDAEGTTPLIMACRMRKSKMIEQLLAHKTVAKANPNLSDKLGRTPLHWVAELGDADCARALIQASADLNKADSYRDTPFVRAIKANNLEVLDVLIEAGCDRSEIDGLNGTATTMAALLGRTEVMKRLLDAGEDPNEFGHIGFTPLTASVFEGNVETVKLLLDRGADPNWHARMGCTPLVKATTFLMPQMVEKRHEATKLLLRAGADPNKRVTIAGYFTIVTKGRNCPLSFALSAGCISLARMHLIGGCRITASEVDEWMHIMSKHKIEGMAKVLHDWAVSVRSLKFLCRQMIRSTIGTCNVHRKLEKLPLPGPIIRFLQFSDLDDVRPEFGNVCECITREYILPTRPACGLRCLMGTLTYEKLGAPSYSQT